MAKASIDTGAAAQPVHTRTTADSVESQAVVVGIDGSDSVVPAHATDGLSVKVTTLPALPAGSNNVGDMDIATMPAAARTTDTISAAFATDKLMQDVTERTPTFAVIDVAGSGDNTIVAAAGAGNKIRVHQVFLVAAGAVTVRFESGAAGTALTGQMNVGANLGFVLPFSPVGWFETAANVLLNLELSGAISVDGCLVWSIAT